MNLRKYINKRIISIIISFTVFISILNNLSIYANENIECIDYSIEIERMYNSLIPKEADYYVDYIANPLLMSQECNDEYMIGEAFFIYVTDENIQETMFYYPIYINNNIEYIISVYLVNGEWNAKIGKDFIELLILSNYNEDNRAIFYQIEEYFFADNGNELYSFNENVDCSDFLFCDISINDKINIIENEYIHKERKDIVLCEEGTGFSTNTAYEKKLNMSGRLVGQGSDNICWAASVATTLRYLTNSYTYTARSVCDKIGHAYDEAGIYEKQKALKAYGINYSVLLNSQITFERVINNIVNQYPILASTFSSNSGHSITIVGYKNYGGIKMITFHNPGSNELETVIYNSSGTTYSYNNKTFTWKYTLCYL